ncbi:coiled-coil domain-containing protein 127 [Labeo rohita]|uniref:Coiled-coil domain-containing protein 127 n=1 Tax=Labeo rohita TaxID=84645 RepID=A0A498M272_LABRO|nr:coiled-coil domain-containing protein 127b [Labeo rohita]XP_050992212.1 coiled-coil domain-containing protein 127b [Labeo rohita]RXN14640.1 coiled-coil domain-containing protein 127 [Labeo rohita]
MNNLNDPQDWNIRPERQGGGGDSSKWNYALLVPMLGLAAFRWIWSKESQKEIEEAKDKYEKTIKTIQKDLDVKYRQMLSENRRETAHLELDLEKEKQRAHGYRQALASQSKQLEEERRGMRLEREALENERARLRYAGPGGTLFHEALEKEKERERRASLALKDVEYRLVERQRAFCSILVPRARRVEMEKDLLVRTAKEPLLAHLEMEDGLRDIFKNDRSCAEYLNTDERRNGSLMWLYLRYWQLQVTLQTHQRAEAAMLGVQPKK